MVAPGGVPPRLRPMDLGEIIDQTLRLYARNFPVLFLLSVCMQVPLLLAQMPMLLMMGSTFTQLTSLDGPDPFSNPLMLAQLMLAYAVMILGIMVYFLLVRPVVMGSIVHVGASGFMGHKARAGEALRAAWRQALPLIVTTVVLGLGLSVAAMVFLIPVIFGAALFGALSQSPVVLGIVIGLAILLWLIGVAVAYVYTYLYPQVIMVEKDGYFAALGRSFRLVRSQFWRMVGLAILFGLVMMMGGVLFSVPFGLLGAVSQDKSMLVLIQSLSTLGNALLIPLPLLGATVAYYDLRIRKEGYDLEVMADWLAGQVHP